MAAKMAAPNEWEVTQRSRDSQEVSDVLLRQVK